MNSRKIVTAADSTFFYGLLTLLTTFYHNADYKHINLDIWDLGMTESQIRLIRCILRTNWNLRRVDELGQEPFQNAFNASMRNFAWKAFCIDNSHKTGETCLWLDAGVAVSNQLDTIFENIEQTGYLFIQNGTRKNNDWISSECISNMNVNDVDLNSYQVHGNILGFSQKPSSVEILKAWRSSCTNPSNLISNEKNHRHDQTVLSILISKHKLSLVAENKYLIEGSDFNKANKKVFFLAHRQAFNWIDFNALINNQLLK